MVVKRVWHTYGFIYISCLIGLMLAIWPLPEWAINYRPKFLALFVIYWTINSPYYFNLGAAWCFGILLDTLYGTTLGEHALGLVFIAYICARMHRQLRVFPLWQQMLIVLVLVFFYQLVILFVQAMLGQTINNGWFWIAPITSAMLWPWLFILLRDYRRYFNID
jgi:rod shape-determining protein MreD